MAITKDALSKQSRLRLSQAAELENGLEDAAQFFARMSAQDLEAYHDGKEEFCAPFVIGSAVCERALEIFQLKARLPSLLPTEGKSLLIEMGGITLSVVSSFIGDKRAEVIYTGHRGPAEEVIIPQDFQRLILRAPALSLDVM